MLTIHLEQTPVLETDRLRLRPLQDKDAEALFALRSNPVSMQYIARPIAKTMQDIEELMQKIRQVQQDKKGFWWGITLNDMDTIIGNIGIFNIDADNYRAEIGYMLLPDYFEKGIMHEVLCTIVPFGFKELALHSIYANIDPANIASAKLLEKNNFLKEAFFKENYYFDGKFLDTIVYSKLATAP
jgi:[ribosomal protein S5]-alanine N-acetyltransferase